MIPLKTESKTLSSDVPSFWSMVTMLPLTIPVFSRNNILGTFLVVQTVSLFTRNWSAVIDTGRYCNTVIVDLI